MTSKWFSRFHLGRVRYLVALALVKRSRAAGSIIFVQMMPLNIVNDRNRNEVSNAHLTSQKQTDFRAADVVLDQLLNDMNVVSPRLQRC